MVGARRKGKGQKTGEVVVREVRPGDGVAIARLRLLSDAQHAASLPDYFRAPAPGARPVPWSSAAQRVLVAEEAGEAGLIRGYLVLHLVGTPPDPASMPGPRARVDAVVVDPAVRRLGVGRKLMAEAARQARAFGARDLVLTVWRGNEAAEAFYAALGFTPLARVLRHSLTKS